MECSSCHAALPDDARFCLRCGAAAAAPQPVEPADPLRATLAVALGRQYEVGRLLGRGGMGAVYHAREAALEREVAIKVLPPDRGDTPESRERFRREARTAARLSHPNIVPLHTFGDVDGTLYLVMGYVKGESLAARVRRAGRLSVEESRRILIEVAEALDYAHALGIVHRDIKADNVLIDEGTGRAMLTDFGVAKALGAGQTVTSQGSIVGTPHYMSPEQAQGKADLDGRSDLYSLGVMAYAMLGGRLPFDGATPGDILVQHISKEAPPLATLAPGLPPELVAAIVRCLAKQPGERFARAQAFRDAIAPEVADGPQPEAYASLWQATQIAAVAGFAASLLYLNQTTAPPPADPLDFPFVQHSLPRLVLSIAGLAVAAALLTGFDLKRKGHPAGRIVRAALLKPAWWFGPYPRRLRAPGDVWRRLPLEIRRVRTLMTCAAAWMLLFLIPFMIVLLNDSDRYRRTGKQATWVNLNRKTEDKLVQAMAALQWAIVGAGIYFFVRWRGSALAGSTLIEKSSVVDRFLFWDTGRASNWSRPEVRSLLLSPAAASEIAPTTAEELVRGIEAARPTLQGGDGAALLAAAHELAAAIAAGDRQIESLAGTIDPREAERLAERLSALGPPTPGENDDRRQMRELFQKQLDVARRVEARLREANAERARRVELLRALWQAAREHADASAPERNVDRLRGLLREVGLHGAATATHIASSTSFSERPTLEK